jgi:hypothetical protein
MWISTFLNDAVNAGGMLVENFKYEDNMFAKLSTAIIKCEK